MERVPGCFRTAWRVKWGAHGHSGIRPECQFVFRALEEMWRGAERTTDRGELQHRRATASAQFCEKINSRMALRSLSEGRAFTFTAHPFCTLSVTQMKKWATEQEDALSCRLTPEGSVQAEKSLLQSLLWVSVTKPQCSVRLESEI